MTSFDTRASTRTPFEQAPLATGDSDAGMSARRRAWELLVYLTKKDLGERDGGLAELLPSQPEWGELILSLAKHGLLVAFDRSVQLEGCEGLVPAPMLEFLHSSRNTAQAVAFLREQVASRVLKALVVKSIPVMPVKGMHLSEKVYGCPDIRQFADIDLMTAASRLHDAVLVLAELGLEPQPSHTPTFRWTGGPEVVFELDAFREQTKSTFRETYLLDVREIWTAARATELLGVPVLEMRPEHLLIYLALHLAERHYFEKLIWLRDLREVIDRYADTLDWDYLLDCAYRWRAKSYTYFSLLLASRLAAAAVRVDVLERLRPRYPEARLFERSLAAHDGLQLPLREWSFERQLLSVLGDGWARRTWARLTFPVHALIRLRRQTCSRLPHQGRTAGATVPGVGEAP